LELQIAELKEKIPYAFCLERLDSSSIATISQRYNMQKLIASFAQQMQQAVWNPMMLISPKPQLAPFSILKEGASYSAFKPLFMYTCTG
jgi:hypothetical protein